MNSPLPETLARLERRLEPLRSMRAQGRLSPAQYQEEIRKLMATDEQGGSWWLAGEEGWFQAGETMASLTSCYILNTQSGEKYYPEPREGGWTREIAGFAVPLPWTVYWCPVGPMGDVNAMMRTGKEALMASGHCQACRVTMPE